MSSSAVHVLRVMMEVSMDDEHTPLERLARLRGLAGRLGARWVRVHAAVDRLGAAMGEQLEPQQMMGVLAGVYRAGDDAVARILDEGAEAVRAEAAEW